MSDLAATNCGCGEDRGGCGCNTFQIHTYDMSVKKFWRI